MEGYFGIIYDEVEIRTLILFIMRRLSEPVTLDVLAELTIRDESISYFDVTECILKLAQTGHLSLKDEKYSLTAKGVRNGEVLENNLPYAVRQKAEEAAAYLSALQKRDKLIKTGYSADDKGAYKVMLSLSDGIGDIFSAQLLAANEEQAEKLIKGFRKNAENIYHRLVESIIS
ncbi:MAG: DUF4364 family protein [Oscillospiraceae bacterium]|nr:DUF4364 family protein [Oscillospiraceae bacterium]